MNLFHSISFSTLLHSIAGVLIAASVVHEPVEVFEIPEKFAPRPVTFQTIVLPTPEEPKTPEEQPEVEVVPKIPQTTEAPKQAAAAPRPPKKEKKPRRVEKKPTKKPELVKKEPQVQAPPKQQENKPIVVSKEASVTTPTTPVSPTDMLVKKKPSHVQYGQNTHPKTDGVGTAKPSKTTTAVGSSQTGSADTSSGVDPSVLRGLRKGYYRSVSKLLHKHKRYPRLAVRTRKQGVVELLVRINAQGKVLMVKVSRSSGHQVLDRSALETIKRLGRLPTPPRQLTWQVHEFKIPIRYRLR